MKRETTIVHAGRHPEEQFGAVNPPITQTSTVLFPSIEAFHAADVSISHHQGALADPSYGITGTSTTFALAEALSALEGADKTLIYPSGLMAITATLLSFTKTGDHVLVPDSVYGPARRFCNKELKKLGIETTYYDPLIGAGIASLMRDNTKIILTESPGSLTFEIQDIPAISKAAKAKNPDVVIALDNSWASPLYFQGLSKGVDVVMYAATKYINGHSDVLMGTVSANSPHAEALFRTYKNLGISTSPHDCYQAMRGLRTMGARLRQHEESTMVVAKWLENHPAVAKVLYPALPSHPQHALWKRDFTGASGLLGFILKTTNASSVHRMINSLQYYGIGASWGGYESLIIDFDPTTIRTATQWAEKGHCVRIHIGLENVDDLIQDLDQGFKYLA